MIAIEQRHFTQNHKCEPHVGTIQYKKARGLPKSVGFIIREPLMSVQNVMPVPHKY